jgi:nucleotide-binding universal stress UspA family protein
MSSPTQHRPLDKDVGAETEPPKLPSLTISRIAAGVDGYPEGRDAVALGRVIAEATGAELMLVAVHQDPIVPMPSDMSWKSLRKEAERKLREVRDSHAPHARIVAESDVSIPRALHRVVRAHHRDLLVLGSIRDAPDGRVRIGKRTRQLLCHFECALAIAPRGMHAQPAVRLRKIGVGYDGGPESEAALALAAAIAAGAGADLQIRAVVDDRVPVLLRTALGGLIATKWHDVIAEEKQRLHDQSLAVGRQLGANASTEVLCGRPADALLSLSNDVDLLVIGSRRWGPAARVLLGGTGEALLHDAACPVLAVPRPGPQSEIGDP